MFNLQYLDSAKQDLQDIAAYIARQSQSKTTARRFIDQLLFKCEQLAESSFLLGVARPELRPDLRSIPYGNYVIFFRHIEEGNILQIVRIIEGHRDIGALFE